MNQSPATILLVDDVAANRDALVALLEAGNYRFTQAASGPEALAEWCPVMLLQVRV